MIFDFFGDNVACALSEVSDGNMSLNRGPEQEVLVHRKRFLASLGIDDKIITSMALNHGKNVCIVDSGGLMQDTDALLTKQSDLILFATYADCIPLYYYDQGPGVIGLAHAGWRGIIKKLPMAMILDATDRLFSSPKTLKAIIGPSIQNCCYQVGAEVAGLFRRSHVIEDSVEERDGEFYVNLQKACFNQLTIAGVLPYNIQISPHCTACCSNLFFSHRLSKGKCGAMAAVIMRRD